MKYNLLRVRDPKITASGWAHRITGPRPSTHPTIHAPVDVRRAAAAAFDLFQSLNIVDRDTVEGPDGKSKAVGTGPFALDEWAQGDHLNLVKNRNYWQSGRPYPRGNPRRHHLRINPQQLRSSKPTPWMR